MTKHASHSMLPQVRSLEIRVAILRAIASFFSKFTIPVIKRKSVVAQRRLFKTGISAERFSFSRVISYHLPIVTSRKTKEFAGKSREHERVYLRFLS